MAQARYNPVVASHGQTTAVILGLDPTLVILGLDPTLVILGLDPTLVILGLDPRIHSAKLVALGMDPRGKPEEDGETKYALVESDRLH